MQEILGGVVAIIAIAITIGIGTSILGSTGSAFDCKTLDGYTAAGTTGATAIDETKRTTGGDHQYNVRFQHAAPVAGTFTGTFTVTALDGSVIQPNASVFTPSISTFPDTPGAFTTEGVALYSITGAPITGTVSVTLSISATVQDGDFDTATTVSFSVTYGSTTTAESYTGWAKACQDAQRQTTQAWTLIPIILIVIVAAIIITVLRGFYGSTG